MIHRMQAAAVKLYDTSFILRFLLKLFAFYFLFRLINWLMIGIISPAGSYSYFIDHYLNYIDVLKVSLLYLSSVLASVFGVSSHLLNHSTIQILDPVPGSDLVIMAWACVGLDIMSFWAAFVLADSTTWRKKLAWLVGGLLTICIINIVRITLLLLAIKEQWSKIGTFKHHDTFNYAAYAFVFLLMFIYYKKNMKEAEA